jgi:anthranilate/para-aminobenzoate synthase component I
LVREPLPAVLDSAGGPDGLARFTILACDPFQVLSHAAGQCTVTQFAGCHGCVVRSRTRKATTARAGTSPVPTTTTADRQPFKALREELARFQLLPPAEPDVPLRAGAIGFLGYELGRYVELLPATARCDIALPDMHWGFYDSVLVLDTQSGAATAYATDLGGREPEELLARWERMVAEASQAGCHGCVVQQPCLAPNLSTAAI